MSFDFIGFLLTALLSTSHAAKHGARAGLGVTLVRYGLYIQTQDVDDEMAQYKYYNPDDNETREEVIEQNNWTAYLFIIIGFFLIAKANAEFVRVRRVRAVILAGTELENA
ncbi:hypothetical protein HK096_009501 [Nowakowskiella sp. JEL0078]|nr:hypothetical protein HK096_009501 [Nowakowskiella sp. JEL0078]